jgi:hypothetical protein
MNGQKALKTMIGLILASAAWGANAADLPPAAQVLKETGVPAGLAVVVGTTDGRLEADLTDGGKMLVQGLALSDEAATVGCLRFGKTAAEGRP